MNQNWSSDLYRSVRPIRARFSVNHRAQPLILLPRRAGYDNGNPDAGRSFALRRSLVDPHARESANAFYSVRSTRRVELCDSISRATISVWRTDAATACSWTVRFPVWPVVRGRRPPDGCPAIRRRHPEEPEKHVSVRAPFREGEPELASSP